MSWFFGKKKHKESPPDSPEEEAAPDDGFIFVAQRPEASDDASGLYPSLDRPLPYPPAPAPFVKENSQEGQANDLSNIPFKLCKELERTMNDDLVIDKLRLEEIVSFIQKINIESYNYEFDIERSVINEMNSQNEE